MGNGDAEDVEIAEGRVGFQGSQAHPPGAQELFQVGGGNKGPLRPDLFPLVQDVVNDLQAQVAHPDLVEIGEGQGHADFYPAGILLDGIEFQIGRAHV